MPTTRRRLQGTALFIAGLVMLVVGVPTYQTYHGFLILSIVGFVVMFAGVVFGVTGPKASGGHPSVRPVGGPGTGQRRHRSAGSFSSRMEDRFRRRFDQ